MSERCDVAVVGGGSGGYVAAIRASQLGLKVVLIEEAKVGGTCLHQGCIPTKALLQSAAVLDGLRNADKFGVTVADVRIDYGVASRRRDDVVNQLHRGVEYLLKKNRVTVIRGRGRFDGSGRVMVEGADGVEAGAILLATGSRPRMPGSLSPDDRHVMTSDQALRLDHIPRSAIVLGAGAVGVEFASLWRSFGADVTLVEMAEQLVPLEDQAVGQELTRAFEARGIRCLVGATMDLGSIERNEGGVAVSVAVGGREERLQAEVLLIAVGRSANVDDIGLDGSAVRVDRGTVVVDQRMATAQPGVWAVGDMVGGFWLAHKAMHEGIIAAEAIAGQHPHPLDSRLIARTTYCTPQIASLGLSEREARDAGHDVAVGVMPFRGNGRALVWGEAAGFCKVVANRRTQDVLGVHIIGHEVTELIAGPALGALLEATPLELGRSVAPHPTLSEVLGEAALAVSGQAIHV